MEKTNQSGKEAAALLTGAGHVHFIGIGGAGMRTLAVHLGERGYKVTGSDRVCDGEGALYLGIHGIVVVPPSPYSGIIDADLAVYSLAIEENDIEMQLARDKGIPLLSRAELLGVLSGEFREAVGVAGAHGKSTTSAMLTAILTAVGCAPTAMIGAALTPEGGGYQRGGRGILVFEACEYKSAFLSFCPTVAVLTGAEWEHPDCFLTPAAAEAAFLAYLSLPSVRLAVLSADDAATARLIGGIRVPYVTYGFSETADLTARNCRLCEGGSLFNLVLDGKPIGEVRLSVVGRHNIANALAASAAALALGVAPERIPAALSGYRGLLRRCEYRGTHDGILYYDDYAHHPTEIRASLTALRGRGRLFCVFQPHTYTRTAAFFKDFAEALSLADCTVLVDTYAAREKNTTAVTAARLSEAVGGLFFETPELAALYIRGAASAGDTVVVMGAGDVGARFFRGELSFPTDTAPHGKS